MALVFTPGLARVVDDNGDPIDGAKLYFYLTGTTANAVYYLNADESTAGPHPLVSDANGIFEPQFITTSTTYRVKCTNATGSETLYDIDPASAFPTNGFGASLFFGTWAELDAVTGTTIGESAAVFDDAGTHTDPVTSDTVPNEGLYSWTGTDWQWLHSLSVSAGGSDGQVQYNNTGSLAGADGLTFSGGVITQIAVDQGEISAPAYAASIKSAWNNPAHDGTFSLLRLRAKKTDVENLQHTLVDAQTERADGTSYSSAKILTNGDVLLNSGTLSPFDGYGGGIRHVFADVMALTSNLDIVTGNPQAAPVLFYSWGGGTTGVTALLQGNGSNRLHVNAGSGITLTLEAGQHEREVSAAVGDAFIRYTPFIGSSAIGATFRYQTYGQNPTRSSVLMEWRHLSSTDSARKAWLVGTYNGANGTANGDYAWCQANGTALFQSTDLAIATPGNPAAGFIRLYGKDVAGVKHLAYRDSAGTEVVL